MKIWFSTLPTMYYFYCFCITSYHEHSFMPKHVDNIV